MIRLIPGLGNVPRKGSVLILTVAGAVFIFGILALAIDLAWLYVQKNKLQTSVDAAWKAGFDEMTRLMSLSQEPLREPEKEKIRRRARDVFACNGHSASETERLDVRFPGPATLSLTLEMEANLELDLFFARVLDFKMARVSAFRASARNPFVLPQGIIHGEISRTPDGVVRLHPFSSSEEFVASRSYLLRSGSDAVKGLICLSGGLEKPVALSNQGALVMGENEPAERFRKSLFLGIPRMIGVHQRVRLHPRDLDRDVEEALRDRCREIPDGQNAVFPIIAAESEPMTASGEPLAIPLTALELPRETGVVRIIGFAEFRLDFPESAPGTFPGVIRGTFQKYIVHPREIPASFPVFR